MSCVSGSISVTSHQEPRAAYMFVVAYQVMSDTIIHCCDYALEQKRKSFADTRPERTDDNLVTLSYS